MKNALPKKAGTANGKHVYTHPKLRNSRKSGIMVAWYGKIRVASKRMSSASKSKTRPPWCQFSRCRPRIPTSAGPGMPARCLPTPSIVHPLCRTTQHEHRQRESDDQEDPGQARRIPHPQIGKCGLVEVERIEEARVDRPAIGDDERLGKELEGGDDRQDHVEQDHR